MAILTLENVVKDYAGNVRAVDDFSLEVADGELMVLVGPSGCGKTTLLRMIAGLEPVTRGTISIDGRPLGGVRPKDRDVAMVFQHFALYPNMTVAGNMAFGLKLRRTGKAEIERRVTRAAELLGIGDLLSRRPGELSGGQRQRVALGRAIVRKPSIFLFDEPLSNLDAALRTQMRQEIRRIHARLGTTTLYVTHDQTEAMTLGQRIAVIRQGRLQQVADPVTLYSRPANRFVAALIGSPAMNFFEGRIERREGRLLFVTERDVSDGDKAGDDVAGGTPQRFTLPIPAIWTARIEPYAERPITLGLRPEHIGRAAAEQTTDAPRFHAHVEAVELVGADVYVHFHTGRQTFVSRMPSGRSVEIGDFAQPAVATDRLHFFDSRTEQALGQ